MLKKISIQSNIFLNKKEMRLDKFINEALFSKDGYYYKNKAIGKTNDFITSPEISQIFGEIISMYILHVWKIKINSKFNFIELGPGKATLFIDIINSIKKYPDFIDKANISLIEINKELLNVQKKRIRDLNLNKINWKKSINFKSKLPSVIYSNEFFDCFAVRQFFLKKFWMEKYVAYNNKNNNFYLFDKIVTDIKLLSKLNLFKKERLLEKSLERNIYFEKVCKFIKKNRGIFITIDYGYYKNIKNFTLQSISKHKYSSIFDNIGEQDISSHVNFTDLLDIAKKYNLKIDEACTQREFLIKYGILERKKYLSSKNKSIKNQINEQTERLIGTNEMGNLFKILIVSNL
tara:strand:- start:2555 stop:3598 length:1044 start_codon:yes stop_codon:yes gene_type:complete